MAKRQTTDTEAVDLEVSESSAADNTAEASAPDDLRDADPQQTPTRGGSYVIEGGVRRLVERTEEAE